mgnify:CR=1 FL=1
MVNVSITAGGIVTNLSIGPMLPSCQNINRYLNGELESSGKVLPIQVIRHLWQCRRCHLLFQALRTEPRRALCSAKQRELEGALKRDLSKVSPAEAPLTRTLKLGLLYLLVSLLLPNLLGFPGPVAVDPWLWLCLSAVLLACAYGTGFSLCCQMEPGARHPICPNRAPALGAAVPLAATLLIRPWGIGFPAGSADLSCVTGAAFLALPALLLVLAVVRRWAYAVTWRIGACAGTLAGLIALQVQHSRCLLTASVRHAVLHCAVFLIVVAAGTVAGYLMSRRRGELSGPSPLFFEPPERAA